MWWVALCVSALKADPVETLPGVPVAVDAGGSSGAAKQGATDPLDPIDAPGVDEGGVVIKTWGFLRDASDNLGARAQDVLSVQEDLKTFEADLAAQREAWEAATAALEQENAALRAQLGERTTAAAPSACGGLEKSMRALEAAQAAAALLGRQQADAAEGTKRVLQVELKAARQQLKDARAENDHRAEAAAKQAGHLLDEKKELEDQVHEIEAMIAEVKAKDASKAEEAARNMTLLRDQVQQLQKERTTVQKNLPKIEQLASRAGFLRTSVAGGQAALAEAHGALVDAEGHCAGQRQAVQRVLAAERAKLAARRAEVASCASIHAQHVWLQNAVAAC